MHFILCVFWCFDTWSLADPREADRPRAGYLLEMANNSKQLLYASQPIQSPSPPHLPTPLSSFYTLGHYPSAIITLGPDTRQLETAPKPENLLKLFTPAYPVFLIPSLKITIQAFAHIFSSLLLPPDQPRCLPVWTPYIVCCASCV
ncbi:hypothetical protein HJG60_010311 [Phyllostomus discolor]|uniref:Uncharacterized protein n=1 Tax=Phyllostomus discolor TaxID=89673 RepID=A0A834EK85_9CHIR|nr:hypothetical protein HJG60_010311 [Phyllostomus discolor]